jgi:N-acyl-D-aspartate/D-glutamate deacylase
MAPPGSAAARSRPTAARSVAGSAWRRALATAAVLAAACAPADADRAGGTPGSEDAPYDLALLGGTVVDGSGGPRFTADVAIRGDRIVAVSATGIDPALAETVIDAEGLVVAPGFIDNHAHIQTTIHEYPLAENFTRQGITTIIASLHSGGQPWPLDAYARSLDVAVNVGFFAGHTWTRRQVLGMEDRAPTEEELDRMRALVDTTMRQGALGLSTGLLYVPAAYAETEEVIELAKVASRHGGIYVSHMRNEASGLLQSVAEVIRIADEADIPAQINHHKAAGRAQWGQSAITLAMIDSARAAGLDVRHDLYPYAASSTGSGILFPQWVMAGGHEEMVARFNDPELRPRIEAEMRALILSDRPGDDMRRIQIRVMRFDPRFNGQTMADVLADRSLPNTLDAAIPVLMELQARGGFSAIYHAMEEEDVIRILQHPLSMIETDGDPVAYGVGFPHPRSYGAFPRVLARYVRELDVITLEEAVRKMTAMPAEQYGQTERGLVAEGMLADLTVFDPGTIADRATYTDPHQYAVGVHHLIVNGEPVILGGAYTGERPGRWIRGPARPPRTD